MTRRKPQDSTRSGGIKPAPPTKYAKFTRGGQITIPKAFRDQLGITDDSMVVLTLRPEGTIEIRPAEVRPKVEGSPWARELYRLFAPMREATAEYPETEVDADIDQALAETRASRKK